MSQNLEGSGVQLMQRLRHVKERPFRSFKMRYLLYSLPLILFISGLLTIILASFANSSLDQQYRQQMGNLVAGYTEELRMIILSRNLADLQDFLQRLSGQIDSNSMVLLNAQNEQVAAFSERRTSGGEYSITYTHILLMQSVAGQAEEWRLVATIKPSPLVKLIDNFLLYQLLIISVMVLGSVISTFLAFEKSVNRPVHELKKMVERGLVGHAIAADEDVFDNDEFGELGIYLHEMILQSQNAAQRFEFFSIQTGVACFKMDFAQETLHFLVNPGPILGQHDAVIQNLNDLWGFVSDDQRGNAKQAWFDIKEAMQVNETGDFKIELRTCADRDDYAAPSSENWVKLLIVWNKDGDDLRINGYICNITNEKKRELEFLGQAEKYRKIYENLPVGIWRSQSDKFVYMNQAMADILGYASPAVALEKIKSINHDLYLSPVDRTFFLDELKKRDQVKNIEMKFKKADGKIFWGAVFGRLCQEKNVQYVEGGFIDITTRKEAEDKLRGDEEFLRQGLETAGIVSWQIDSVSGQMFMKGPVGRLLGGSGEGIDSLKGFCRLVHSDDMQRFVDSFDRSRRLENVANRYRERDINRIEFRICRLGKDHKTELRWLQASFSLADSSVANRSGIVRGLFIDITPLKEGEEHLKQAIDKARHDSNDKLQFFANISHDIRTPLNAIIGFSELLSPILHEGKGEQYIGSILSASRSLINIIDTILDLARLESGRVDLTPEPVCLLDLAKDLQQFFSPDAAKKELVLNVLVDGEVPSHLLLDEMRIRQVLANLLGNAIKFTSKGMVSLKVALAHSPKKGLVNLLMSVEDSGIGIPEDDLRDIFDPFSIKRGKGDRIGSAGIGLAICERLIGLMNGSIKVKSDVERGTRFEIILREVPVVSGEQKVRSASIKSMRSCCFFGQKVLVADDTSSNRELLTEALTNAGLKVIAAADGNEAVRLAKEEKPALIFMDIRMPEKDGICAARELKCFEATSSIPIVAVTASVSFAEEARLKGFFDGFLSKPISLAKLFAEAARFLKHDMTESRIEKTESCILPPEAFEQLREPWKLCEVVNREIMPLLADLEGVVVVKQIKEFADLVKNISVTHSFNFLALEAEKLANRADAFDVAGVRDCCSRMRGILTQLTKVYSRGGT